MDSYICPKCERGNVFKVNNYMNAWIDQMHCRDCDYWFGFKTMVGFMIKKFKEAKNQIKTEYDKVKENIK